MSERVAIGVVTRPHGVQGEVRVHPFNADSNLLGRLAKVWAVPENGAPRELTIARCRRAPKHWIITFEGVQGREAADDLRGTELQVLRDELPDLEEDEIYLADLEGLEVRYQDQVVGTVERVLTYPSVVCLEVVGPDGKRELPMVPPWVTELDIDEGWVLCESWDDVPEAG